MAEKPGESATTLGLEGRPDRGLPEQGLSLRIVGDGIFSTQNLPPSGDLVIGRSGNADIRIDDPSISRSHAVLHLGPPLTIEDLGSVNGTRVGDQKLEQGKPVAIGPGEVVDLGSVMVIVQPRTSAARPRRVWTHGYFEGRLEEECARAVRSATGDALAVIRIHLDGDATGAEETIASALRASDSLAAYGPGEWEVLLCDAAPADAEALVAKISQRMKVRAGIACFPRDGRTPEALIAKANGDLAGGEKAQAAAEAFDRIVIQDPSMQRLYRLVDRIATGTISVLLLGETGVGKEILAEAIHRRSPRKDKPFLRLNCAALSETLLESELFGHEKGAFTGALAAKPGLLETADTGTVFLDEIGELPMPLQVKLLRVLEERQVLRVGGLKPRPIDVRFVAATNRDLEAEIARGGFRQDLYFRLNGMSLVIPPLRERVAEIEGLASAFLSQACRAAGRKRDVTLSADSLALLKGYSWPGNIRELRNVIERAVLLCVDDVITPEQLPVEKMRATHVAPAPSSPPPSSTAARRIPMRTGDSDTTIPPSTALKGEIEALERQRIIDTLDACAGNQTQAAKILGISRGTLLSRLEAYGLPRPRKKSKDDDVIGGT